MTKFAHVLMLFVAILLSGCGYSSTDGELIGQVKKTSHATPMICPNYDMADISLGVLRNGVGSMSTQDVWVVVENQSDLLILKKASESGAIVHVHYNVWRAALCHDTDHITTSVALE